MRVFCSLKKKKKWAKEANIRLHQSGCKRGQSWLFGQHSLRPDLEISFPNLRTFSPARNIYWLLRKAPNLLYLAIFAIHSICEKISYFVSYGPPAVPVFCDSMWPFTSMYFKGFNQIHFLKKVSFLWEVQFFFALLSKYFIGSLLFFPLFWQKRNSSISSWPRPAGSVSQIADFCWVAFFSLRILRLNFREFQPLHNYRK